MKTLLLISVGIVAIWSAIQGPDASSLMLDTEARMGELSVMGKGTANGNRKTVGYLPTLSFPDAKPRVVGVYRNGARKAIYVRQIRAPSFRPPVFSKGDYTVRVGSDQPEKAVYAGGIDTQHRKIKVLAVDPGFQFVRPIVGGPGAGRDFVSTDYDDQVLVLEFIGTRCAPCIAYLPHLKELQKAYAGQVQLVAVMSEPLDMVKPFCKKYKAQLNYPLLHDSSSLLAKHFKVHGYPTTLVLRRGQLLRSTHPGTLEKILTGELGLKPKAH